MTAIFYFFFSSGGLVCMLITTTKERERTILKDFFFYHYTFLLFFFSICILFLPFCVWHDSRAGTFILLFLFLIDTAAFGINKCIFLVILDKQTLMPIHFDSMARNKFVFNEMCKCVCVVFYVSVLKLFFTYQLFFFIMEAPTLSNIFPFFIIFFFLLFEMKKRLYALLFTWFTLQSKLLMNRGLTWFSSFFYHHHNKYII